MDRSARKLLEDEDVVKAAGGLVWRGGRSGPRLAVVHRPRQDDWRLPKGKLKRGEDFTEAAAREVAEETGCRPKLVEFAGYALYARNRRPKVALFWHMTADGESRFEPNDEIDRVKWVTPEGALDRIKHPAEPAAPPQRAAGGGGAAPLASRGSLRTAFSDGTGAPVTVSSEIEVVKVGHGQGVKNVVIFLGGGMGAAHRTAARIISKGVTAGDPEGWLAMEQMPGLGLLSTHSLNSIVTPVCSSRSRT